MGTAIGDIVPRQKITLDTLNGKTVGIDSYNIIYQFLSSIRGEDGMPLKDSHGNVTSHLAGLFYRTINLVDKGIRPVFVFDGKPSTLKGETLRKRHKIRTEAFEKHAQALAAGNLEDAKKFGSRALKLDEKMISGAKELVSLMGFTVIEAPQEGEAQAALMCLQGKIDGAVTQDYDALLFGTPVLYRNVAASGKRKIPGRKIFADVEPEKITLENVLLQNNISREKLIWLGILVGTDFNEKFPKIGVKTALKLVKEHDSFDKIVKTTGHEIDFDFDEVYSVFANPVASHDYKISFSAPQQDKLLDFLCGKHDFSNERVANSVAKLAEKFNEKSKQSTLGRWF